MKGSAPVLVINQFHSHELGNAFYANVFSNHLREHHQHISTPHKHDFYLTVIFTNGTGTHEIDFQSYPIQPGSVFFLAPGQLHNWTLSDDIEGFIFFHSKSFYELHFANKKITDYPFFYSSHNSPYLQLGKKESQIMEEYFRAIYDEFETSLPMANTKIVNLVDLVYIDLTRIALQKTSPQKEVSNSQIDFIHQLEVLIDTHYRNEKFASQYAERLNMSAKHLNRITQNVLGKSTSQIIAERVLLEAKRMLIHSDASFQNLSDELGFKDYAYFSRWFKKLTSETPSQFQKRTRFGD